MVFTASRLCRCGWFLVSRFLFLHVLWRYGSGGLLRSLAVDRLATAGYKYNYSGKYTGDYNYNKGKGKYKLGGSYL